MITAMIPTRAQVEDLKSQWLFDGCWDIEDTEGYELYRDELLAFRLEAEAKATADYNAQLEAKADELGVPGNIKLAEYVMILERRLDQITTDLEKVWDRR